MCGIVGQIFLTDDVEYKDQAMETSLKRLGKRGPDYASHHKLSKAHLGHARLSIIDTSEESNQPFLSNDGRYALVFNGEIFNFKSLREDLIRQGVEFRTEGDTEVLLHLLIAKGADGIQELNGFFSFCFYDSLLNKTLLARDRYGIKPLVFFKSKQAFTFASEIKALHPFIGKQKIDAMSLRYFFQFNYIASPYTILENVFKLKPGCFLQIDVGRVSENQYYEVDYSVRATDSYEVAKKKVYDLMHLATERRMISDVPLGTFLSGGIDSSVVSIIAAKFTSNLKTFSIGFKDHPFFDETNFAEKVATQIKSDHTVIKLSNDDLLSEFSDALDYFDEPFADSSALNMYILSKHTKKNVTVALSGDGADELFSGYNKHQALYQAEERSFKNTIIKNGGFVADWLPRSRDSKLGNLGRKLKKFSDGLQLSSEQRYLLWASFMQNETADRLTASKFKIRSGMEYLSESVKGFNQYLYNDFKLVLEGDMLRKVDAMSMANSLEVRTPFLDVELVDYVFGLPPSFKIDGSGRKKILKDAFFKELPSEIFNRGKQGFEVPLKQWFLKELKSVLDEKVFNKELIEEQGMLNWEVLTDLKKQLYSGSSEDAVYNVWAVLCFQNWYMNYLKEFM